MPNKKRKLRQLGIVMLDVETVLEEMVDHDLQWGEILSLVHCWLQIHAPGAKEEYEDGGSPVFKYE